MERTPAEVAAAIRLQITDLAILARTANLDTLGFLLEMTLIESMRLKTELERRPHLVVC